MKGLFVVAYLVHSLKNHTICAILYITGFCSLYRGKRGGKCGNMTECKSLLKDISYQVIKGRDDRRVSSVIYNSNQVEKPYKARPPLLEMGNYIGYIVVHFPILQRQRILNLTKLAGFLFLAEHPFGLYSISFADFINPAWVYPDNAGNVALGFSLTGQPDNIAEY